MSKPLTVLLPGGNSPKVFLNELSNYSIDWNKISLMATDDRIVPLTSNSSNTGMIKRELVDRISNKYKPELIRLYPKNKNNIENKLKLLEKYFCKNIPKVAFLGIGKDGHTAGVFEEKITKKNCYLLKNSAEPFYRITISMNLLMTIPHLIFFVLGSDKKSALEKIFFDKKSNNFLPAKFLLKNGLGEKIILCDRKAAPSAFNLGESKIYLN